MKNPAFNLILILFATLSLALSQASAAHADDVEVVVETVDSSDERLAQRDGLCLLLDAEIRDALSDGKVRRANYLLGRLVELEPDNRWARRELARTTAAMGETRKAIELFGEVAAIQGDAPDPELYFLWGEALLSVGEKKEALERLATAEEQLLAIQQTDMTRLWRARIHALRGEAKDAALLYYMLVPDDPESPMFESALLGMAEGYIIAKDYTAAEEPLVQFLAAHPDHQRAREMLAWTYEARGKLTHELGLRAELSDEMTTRPADLAAAHARALERNNQYEPALREYRRASNLGSEVDTAIYRLEGRLATEVGAEASVYNDPLGERLSSRAGFSMPLTERLRLAATAGYELATTPAGPMTERAVTELVLGRGWLSYESAGGSTVAAGATGWQVEDGDGELAGQALLRTSPGAAIGIEARGEVNAPWRETALTIRYGGTVESGQVHTWLNPGTRRVVLLAGGNARRMTLGAPGAVAEQVQGFAGVDTVLSWGNRRVGRGHILDSELVTPHLLASGVVLSLRHYEMASTNPFPMRLSLVTRSRLDEVSLTARHVVDRSGVWAVEGQSGLGYDSIRELWRWRASALTHVSITPTTRLSASFETSSETMTGITGRRVAAMLGFHVDI